MDARLNQTIHSVRWESENLRNELEQNISWFGQPISTYKGKLKQLKSFLPTFERKPFGNNEFLDVIFRKPEADEPTVSVAAVSKNYALVQHVDLLDTLREAIGTTNLDPEDLEGTLVLSKYGERMFLSLEVPGYGFDPGDGYPIILKLDCLNSVDKRTALVFRFKWERLVCSNGMVCGIKDSRIRKIHSLQCMNPKDLKEFFHDNLSHVPGEHALYEKWMNTPVTLSALIQWTDKPLAKIWGSHTAARAFNITRNGWDGNILNPFVKTLPHEKEITETKRVPGACAPVQNAFHVSQVLSWLAREQKTIQGQLEKMMQIGGLMKKLLDLVSPN